VEDAAKKAYFSVAFVEDDAADDQDVAVAADEDVVVA
jgi:hypothetical protein